MKEFLSKYIIKQTQSFFPDGKEVDKKLLEQSIEKSLLKLEKCFSHIDNKYYLGDFKNVFNHLNADHYAMFLYWLGHHYFKDSGQEDFPSKIFLLNKMLHSVDMFYKVKLPEIFMLVHPLGTILGNAEYSDFMVFYQGCTIGSKVGGGYPSFEGETVVYSNTSILGEAKIGKNVVFAANSSSIEKDVASDSLVTGFFPDNKHKKLEEKHYKKFFKV